MPGILSTPENKLLLLSKVDNCYETMIYSPQSLKWSSYLPRDFIPKSIFLSIPGGRLDQPRVIESNRDILRIEDEIMRTHPSSAR